MQNKNSSGYTEYIPDSIAMAMCDIPPKGFEKSVTLFGNNNGIWEPFRKLRENFASLKKAKAYMHLLEAEGVEEEELTEAEENLGYLITEYEQQANAPAKDDSDFEDSDDESNSEI